MTFIAYLLWLVLNVLTPWHDIHVVADRRSIDVRFTALCVWRYQQPETMRCLSITFDGRVLP